MADDPVERLSLLRRILPWMTVLVLIAAIYDGAVFYSRWSANRDAEQARAAKELAHERAVSAAVGGDELKILSFYASPGAIHSGDKANICYGVNGAKTVRLEPPVDEVWPALTRCVQASPRKDTEYKLTAEDGAGHSVSQSLIVKVVP